MPKFIAVEKGKSYIPEVPILTPGATIGAEGDIYFTVTDASGTPWYVATISTTTGKLSRSGCLPKSLGLSLDNKGRILDGSY